MLQLLAETEFDPPEDIPYPYEPGPLDYIIQSTGGFLFLLYFVFKVWMLIECFRKDPDRYIWILLMLFIPGGPIFYFFLRWLPANHMQAPSGLRRFTRRSQIQRLEIAAQQIGNAYQFLELGEALIDIGKYARATQAFDQALQKEPDNIQALWGAARCDMQADRHAQALERLTKILDQDPKYKFGDVSLEYAKALHELGEDDNAITHLEDHINRWRHPEGLFLLATLYLQEGREQEAREQLKSMLLDINGSPRAIARKYGMWKSRARKLLKKIPPAH